MKPLRVLLIHRENDNYRRLTGWWSYPVPEFTWNTKKVQAIDFSVKVEPGYDLIVMDDWIFGSVDKQGVPLAYVIVDSARSDAQLARNIQQASLADLLLIDSDDLSKFNQRIPVRRFAHAVNERLFFPRDKRFDVSFLCWPTHERREVCELVREICLRHGWSFLTGTFKDASEYALAIGSAKVVVHKAHVVQARSWRVFDVMASGCCLLSSHLPSVDGDYIVPGVHFLEYASPVDIEPRLEELIENYQWRLMAKIGYDLVIARHTWYSRATQLRQMLRDDLGL